MLAANDHQAEQLSDRLFRGSWYKTARSGTEEGRTVFWVFDLARNSGNMFFIFIFGSDACLYTRYVARHDSLRAEDLAMKMSMTYSTMQRLTKS